MKILYTENHPKFSSLISRHLLSEHSVVIAPSIAEAASKVSTDVYDLVLLDYDLDDGKGVELMPLLKGLSDRPKIIAVSSHEDGNNALLAAGADAVCYKKDISNIGTVIQSLDCLKNDPFRDVFHALMHQRTMERILSLIFLFLLFIIPNYPQRKSINLTNNDKAEIIKSVLFKEDLLNRVLYAKENKEIIYLSSLNIASIKLPKIQGLKSILINRDQLKEKTKTGFHYFEFRRFRVTASKVEISFGQYFENTGFGASYSNGNTYCFKKVKGKWKGKRIGGFGSMS